MKRDWDLLREQLLAIEDERDFKVAVLEGVTEEPTWQAGQSEAEFAKARAEYKRQEARVFGHLEMLIDSGYIEGVTVRHGSTGVFYGLSRPRLTMAGHDLLDTMRSKPVWEKIKSIAKAKGLELTLDAVKGLAEVALKSVLGS
ncbi:MULTISPECIES: DUF2513 domain-containing protein [unclassified Polaromonas]|uniref:DUF2513 domain-containing protein n=1 Tax=unclassified Polaromonas TaxID=2638319 RepID=UPI000F091EDC|nr:MULTISPECIES: DUF2513 domain-containing protein [unclassified Polaromonas]AYQ27483.1 DUF2513 domain-containing protein [Polaromonas sp. SP1]QGJ17676.1 DUF2513 domain-containing protein [Polaromonas sp. Pch-P]